MQTVGEALQQARRLAATGKLFEAEVIHRRLVEALPDAAQAWGELGVFYLSANRPDAAIEPLSRAIQLDPKHGGYQGAMGAAHRLLGHSSDAVSAFERALTIGPPTAALHNNLALAQKDAGQHDAALVNFDAALAMQPNYQTGHYNRGNFLLGMERAEEAAASFERAVELDPQDAAAHCSLGVAYFDLVRFDDALAALDRALALRPGYPEARRNQALVWFSRGEYAKAWPAFESRLQCEDFAQRDYDQPRWNGTSLAGQTLLVHAEQGLGDTLQFVRYLPLAAQAAKRVWFEPRESLRPLLAESGFGQYLLPDGELPDFDVHASLLSLAGFLPDHRGQPIWPGPYLQAPAQRVAHWAARLHETPAFKVGIAWAGNPDHPHDRARSARLTRFAPLGEVPGLQLVSLQKGPGQEQLDDLTEPWRPLDLFREADPSVDPFVETAAIIANLDLIVSVDTAVAHLAAALGTPVWLALAYAPDWRWRIEGATTPWYPDMRLFRQPTAGAWNEVFAKIGTELSRLVDPTASDAGR